MSKIVKIAAIVAVVAILGVASVAVVAYADESATGDSAIWDFGQKVKEAVAEALGITVEKYDETVATAQKQVLDEAVAAGQLTQEQADRLQNRLDETGSLGRMGGPRGGGHGRGPADGSSVLLTVAAEKLGLTEAELRTELQTRSIADLAKEKGVDTQVIGDEYLAQTKAKLDAQVAAGTLTQAQADEKLQSKTEALEQRLTATWEDLGGKGHGRHGEAPDTTPDDSGSDSL